MTISSPPSSISLCSPPYQSVGYEKQETMPRLSKVEQQILKASKQVKDNDKDIDLKAHLHNSLKIH